MSARGQRVGGPPELQERRLGRRAVRGMRQARRGLLHRGTRAIEIHGRGSAGSFRSAFVAPIAADRFAPSCRGEIASHPLSSDKQARRHGARGIESQLFFALMGDDASLLSRETAPGVRNA